MKNYPPELELAVLRILQEMGYKHDDGPDVAVALIAKWILRQPHTDMPAEVRSWAQRIAAGRSN